MSPNPPDLKKLITPDLKKKMLSGMLKQIKKFPVRNVAEDLPTYMERKMKLTSGTSARPGPYRFENAPFWREVAMNLSESTKITENVVMAATQTGKTVVMMGHEQYCVEYGIGPINYTSSDEGLALKHSETRFGPMLQAAGMMNYISAPVHTRANKGTGDKLNLKFFKGTFIQFTGARSESKASSTPIRVLHIDEIDKFLSQLSGGGNPIVKFLRRTDSYGNLKKIFYVSTPKRKESSQIEPLFEQGDMRYYFVECQGCGEMHRLEWKNIEWDKDENKRVLLEYDDDDNMINDPVWHNCPHCGYKMKCHEKSSALKEEGHGGRAKWIPTKKPDRPGIRSYHVNALYGFRSWLDIVLEFQDAKDDKVLLEDFVCDTLAETWVDSVDKPDEHYLAARAETDWERGQIPEGVAVMTMGVDVHPDRLEAHLVGFGRGKEAWSIDYYVWVTEMNGVYDPNDEVWDKLEEQIRTRYERMDETPMEITTCLIDAQGKASDVVHAFCSRFPYSPGSFIGVFPTLGKQTLSKIAKAYPGTIPAPDVHIDDQKLKMEIYQNLKKKVPAVGGKFPGGFLHYHNGYHTDFFKQLTAEDVITESNKRGDVKILIGNPSQRRNETLDTLKMALGALYFIYLTFFEAWNSVRKKKKQKEMPVNWQLFWAQYGIVDEGDEE